MKQYSTNSEIETKNLAKKLAKQLNGVIALTGELGAGKTTFVQGFAQGLGITEKVISPTFVLIRQHKIPKTEKNLPAGRQALFHIDLYRIENIENLNQLGIKDLLSDQQNIILIEWPEKIQELLPKNTVRIKIEKGEKSSNRLITIS